MRFKIRLRKDGKDKDKTKDKFCVRCGNKIAKYKGRRFCSSLCRTRYYSLKRYNKLKDSKEYKKTRKIYHTQWRKKNKKKFNEMMRGPSREYQRRKAVIKKLEKKRNVK